MSDNELELTVTRFAYHPLGTMGFFHLNGKRLWTIERPWINNAPNISCIPEGIYTAFPYSSERFPDTFEVQDVPGRSLILFCHVGNFAKNVQGCFALGLRPMGDRVAVASSRDAMEIFRAETADVDQIALTVTGLGDILIPWDDFEV